MLSAQGSKWAQMSFLHGEKSVYDAVDNPGGLVWFTNAENTLMHEEMTRFINSHNHFDKRCCSSGEGYTGTLRLREAMAKHLNEYFYPWQAFDPEEITFAAGVTVINEICALVTCNPDGNDSIMLGSPIYNSFSKDLTMRTGVNLEYLHVGDTERFSPDCAAAFDAGFEAAKSRGKNVRALLITNPHNPLGRCYLRETLVALLRLCAAKGIHLISDEIYALSVYSRGDNCPSESFTSVRAIDFSNIIDSRQVHVLYGMSKDYGAAGLRLGCIISQNPEFSNAARAACRFSPPSQFSMDLATKFLEDREYVRGFLRKSHDALLQSRLQAESFLDQLGIEYHQKGNAGLFIWLNLAPYLPLQETNGHVWAAEGLLSQRFTQAGVLIDPGEQYHAQLPGRFRLMFTVDSSMLKEGMRRCV